MLVKLVDLFLGGQIPQPDGAIVGEGHDALVVGEEGRGLHGGTGVVTLERPQLRLGGEVDDLDLALVGAGHEELAVLAEAAAVGALLELGERLVHAVRLRIVNGDLKKKNIKR